MTRRNALFAALIVMAGATSTAFAADRPNVLFIMIDDLRTELGSYGIKGIQTPNIDKLASEGVRFDRAYVQYPLCNPSRTSLLNGRYPSHTGVFDNLVHFRAAHPDFVTLPEFFKQNGYSVLRSGKAFHGSRDDPQSWTVGGDKPGSFAPQSRPNRNQKQTSDKIVELEGDGESHNDWKTATQTIAQLEEYRNKPFFAVCGFTKPHSPPTAPKRFFELYKSSDIPLPPDFAGEPKAPPGFPTASVPARNGDLFIERVASPEEAREMKRAYWASTSWTDWNVGRVIEALDRLNLREKTVIVVWGDHGYHLGEKGKWSKHQSLWEIGTRVPLIFVVPGAKGNGHESPRVVQTVDIYPTLAALCGLPQPAGLDGQSLVPLLEKPDAPWDYPAYTFAGSKNGEAIAVRTEQYRYAQWQGKEPGAMLIDEQADPIETKNLINDPQYADVKKQLQKLAQKQLEAGL